MITKNEEARFIKLLAHLTNDFDSQILDRPDFEDNLPAGCYVIFQIKVLNTDAPDLYSFIEKFNKWVHALLEDQIQPGQKAVVACLTMPNLSIRQPKQLPLAKIPVDDPLVFFQPCFYDTMPRSFELRPV